MCMYMPVCLPVCKYMCDNMHMYAHLCVCEERDIIAE